MKTSVKTTITATVGVLAALTLTGCSGYSAGAMEDRIVDHFAEELDLEVTAECPDFDGSFEDGDTLECSAAGYGETATVYVTQDQDGEYEINFRNDND